MENRSSSDTSSEPQRLARRLHDSVGQTISGLTMMLRGATDDAGWGVSTEIVKGWLRVCERALEELRDVMVDLHEPAPWDHGLEGELHRLVSETGSSRVGLRVEGGGAGLSTAAAQVLLLAAREGIANARKHSVGGIEVVLQFEEDGAGLRLRSSLRERSGGPGLGMGLGSVREAVARVGGSFQTIQKHDRFEVVATVPSSKGRAVMRGG